MKAFCAKNAPPSRFYDTKSLYQISLEVANVARLSLSERWGTAWHVYVEVSVPIQEGLRGYAVPTHEIRDRGISLARFAKEYSQLRIIMDPISTRSCATG